ncbi:MAG TPA: membrane dipeptidase, partial [Polyangiaceae bacterium]|nr:membrane dipeptidase [Polyangiaceae bacterium]
MTGARTIAAFFAASVAVSLVSNSRAAEHAPRFPVVDLHVDLSYEYNFKGKPFELGSGQFSARKLEQGGVRGVVLPLFVPRDASPNGPRLADLERSYARVSEALAHTKPFAPAGCTAPPGSVRTFFAFEGAAPLANDPAALSLWAGRGLRIVGLVHTYANELASSSGDAPAKDFGLTDLGRAFVHRAFELGLVVDVSHASDRAVSD